MKKVMLAVLAAGAALTVASTAQAAGGCGIGFHRGPYGGCRPNGPGWGGPGPAWGAPGFVPAVGTFYPGHGYWYGGHYWGHRYWNNGGWGYR